MSARVTREVARASRRDFLSPSLPALSKSTRIIPKFTHSSSQQIFSFGDDGLLRRHDYVDELAGNFPVAHYVSDYQSVSGLLIPTKRRAFARRPDNTPALEAASGFHRSERDSLRMNFEIHPLLWRLETHGRTHQLIMGNLAVLAE